MCLFSIENFFVTYVCAIPALLDQGWDRGGVTQSRALFANAFQKCSTAKIMMGRWFTWLLRAS